MYSCIRTKIHILLYSEIEAINFFVPSSRVTVRCGKDNETPFLTKFLTLFSGIRPLIEGGILKCLYRPSTFASNSFGNDEHTEQANPRSLVAKPTNISSSTY